MNVTEVLLNLDVVSQVGINDKLVTEGPNFNIRTNSYTRAIMRWWYDESRVKNYDALRSLFANALNLSELLILKKDTESAGRVLVAITPALRGVRNLSQTYRDDVDVFAKFTRLVKDVEDNLRKLSRQLPEGETQIHSDDSGIAPISSSPSSVHKSRTESQAGEEERAECQQKRRMS